MLASRSPLGKAPLGRRPFRRWLAFTLLALGLSSPLAAAEPASAPAGVDSGVRMGSAPAAPAASSEPLEAPRVPAPGDAPRLRGGGAVPPPPSGFSGFDGGWIRFHHHPANVARVRPLIADSTAAREELSERLGVPVLSSVRVDVARTAGEMATFAPSGAPFPEYAAGVAYSEIGLVLLTLTPVHPNDHHELVQIFRHELAHVALHDALAGADVPRWFNEGFAVLASGETSFTRLQTLWTATVADTLLPLDRMERRFPADEVTASIAYAQAVDVVRYLVRAEEQYRFHSLIERLRNGDRFEAALIGSYGLSLAELEQEWREDVAKRYTFWPVLFSGTTIWVGMIGLFALGWRRRRASARSTMERWAREEAREEELRQRLASGASERVHIVLARTPSVVPVAPGMPPTPPEVEVPKVQHEGQWHTLH